MRVLFCGDRNWTDREMIRKVLTDLPTETIIIHGCCQGADRTSGYIADKLEMPVFSFPAQWRRYGPAAGPIRNQQMLDEGLPDKVYAFHDNLDESKGTRDMLDRAQAAGILTTIFKHEEK